jgi:hypothetical protein
LPLTYVSSIDSVVNISGNLMDSVKNHQYGIIANGSDAERILWNQTYTNGEFESL